MGTIGRIAQPASRGLAGHSMGGYGTIRIGMKHPEVFSSIYLLSACCMAPPSPIAATFMREGRGSQGSGRSGESGLHDQGHVGLRRSLVPAPQNPPLFLELPTRDGKYQPQIAAKWAANAPLAMVDQYIANLKRMKAHRPRCRNQGRRDRRHQQDTRRSPDQLRHRSRFRDLRGDHVNRIAERIETKVIPFFSKHLAFE